MGDPRHRAGDSGQIKAGESKIQSYLDKHPLLAGRLYCSPLDMQRRKQAREVKCLAQGHTAEAGQWERETGKIWDSKPSCCGVQSPCSFQQVKLISRFKTEALGLWI